LEESYDDDSNGKSTNMDDTGSLPIVTNACIICLSACVQGFFSVQVLENALKAWDLK
jgi:hypothetical protein